MVAISKLVNNGLLLAGQNIFADVATPQQAATAQYNIINFLGGAAPYVQHPGFGISPDVPSQCTLEQVHLLSRHGERYPSTGTGKALEAIMTKFKNYNETFVGELAFLNDYTFFISDNALLEKETTPFNSQGPYAGTTDAMRHGMSFRNKYKSLFNATEESLKVFTSNSGRVHKTAQYFARGFMGEQYSDKSVEYYVISEDADMGANSLTPRTGCEAYDEDMNDATVAKFNSTYLKTSRERILKGNENLNLTSADVNNFFSWCAYELNVRGASPFCDLFTNEEFIQYSYAYDLGQYYSHGSGHNLTATIAAPYLNATLKFLLEDEPEFKVLLGFSHDTDLEIFHAALGLVEPSADLPTDHIAFPNPYVHSQIVPQGARLYTEKYSCDGSSYVRYIVNDAVYPIQSCQSGPGFSCEISEFESYINKRLEGKDYQTQCNVTDVPTEVTFLWDYATSNYTAADINK